MRMLSILDMISGLRMVGAGAENWRQERRCKSWTAIAESAKDSWKARQASASPSVGAVSLWLAFSALEQ